MLSSEKEQLGLLVLTMAAVLPGVATPLKGAAIRKASVSIKACRFLFGVLVIVHFMCQYVLHLSRKEQEAIMVASPFIVESLKEFKKFVPSFEINESKSVEEYEVRRVLINATPSNQAAVEHNTVTSITEKFTNITTNSTKIPAADFAHLYNDAAPLLCQNASTCPIWHEPSSVVPEWMKTYMDWHAQTRPLVNDTNWKSFRFIIMKCSANDSRCGGTSDRIKPVPLMLWMAYMHKRLLMIHWGRPCKLEEFLVPPKGGIDWRIPDGMINHVDGHSGGNVDSIYRLLKKKDDIIVRIKYQSYHGGRIPYDEQVEGPSFAAVYHDVWRILFTPSPPVAKIIQTKLQEHSLLPGNYAAIHLRALYAVTNRPRSLIESMAKNALACASHLRPGGPFYFASDSEYATTFITKWAGRNHFGRVEAVIRDYEPVHLEMAENWTTRPVSDFYDTFTDLYLLGLSRCVAYGVGGYGEWGLMMGYNSSCSKVHSKKKKIEHCDWYNGTLPEHEHVELTGPILRESMEDPGIMRINRLNDRDELDDGPKELNETTLIVRPAAHADLRPYMPTRDRVTTQQDEVATIWDASESIPQWMKDYFAWHGKSRAVLNESNWESHKFLVMQCLATAERCGGLSDRLKPIPLTLMLAHQSKRLLYVWWQKPAPLQEFLVPPVGGLDWRLPKWLELKLTQMDDTPVTSSKHFKTAMFDNKTVRHVRLQATDAGETDFNLGNHSTTFRELYHDMFRVLFEPSPPVAKEVDAAMARLKLMPGEYVGAHLRALYARTERPYNESRVMGINAIHCASQLRPGGPVYFATDSIDAFNAVREYAKNHSYNVVGLTHHDNPFHLDKASNWTTRKPSEYYPAFIDLYMLGQSRCLTHSNGGYGTMGLYMGFNSSCELRHLHGRQVHICPTWIPAEK